MWLRENPWYCPDAVCPRSSCAHSCPQFAVCLCVCVSVCLWQHVSGRYSSAQMKITGRLTWNRTVRQLIELYGCVWQLCPEVAKPKLELERASSVLQAARSFSERNLTPFVSGFSGGRVKQHPIANPNRHSGEAFGVRTTWGWVQ